METAAGGFAEQSVEFSALLRSGSVRGGRLHFYLVARRGSLGGRPKARGGDFTLCVDPWCPGRLSTVLYGRGLCSERG